MYDYEGAVLCNWYAPALWNRFVIELARVLASCAGLSERAWRTACGSRTRRSPSFRPAAWCTFRWVAVQTALMGAEPPLVSSRLRYLNCRDA